jgi:multidrug resistance efflux pump
VASTTASAPSSSYASSAWNDYKARAGEGSGSRIRELEAQLKIARLAADRAERLRESAAISQAEFQDARSQVDLTLAALQGMHDDFSDELARLKLIIKKKVAELDQARAQKEVAIVVVARNDRLNTRQPGMVAQEDVAKAEAEVRAADAHIRVKEVEHEEPELQLQNVERWRARVRQILATMQKQSADAEPTGTSGAP